MKRLLSLACASGLAAAACGGLSNEDLSFLAALPDDALLIDPPTEAGLALGGRELKPLVEAARVSGHINDFTRKVLESVGTAVATARATSADGTRTWGPYRWKKGYARLEVARDASVRCEGEGEPASGPRYRWTVAWAADKTGPFGVVVEGRTVGDSFASSCGGLRFDLYEWTRSGGDESDARLVDVTWSQRDGREVVWVDVAPRENAKGVLVGDVRYRFERGTSDDGLFRFSLAEDYLEAPAGPERADVVMRWSADRARGRADWTIVDPASQGVKASGATCWAKGLGEVFARDDAGLRPAVGDESACSFGPLE